MSIATRISTTGASLLALPLILTHLTAREQGYYYTFTSLLAAQVFVELGISSVLIQSIAHEQALSPGQTAPRMRAILAFARRWFGISGLIAGIGLATIGTWFLASTPDAHHVAWRDPWLVLCLSAPLSIWASGSLCLLEGLGMVGRSAAIRCLGGITGAVILLLGLLLGWKLWAAAAQALCAQAVMLVCGALSCVPHFRAAAQHPHPAPYPWRAEILPQQWRIAVSFMSGWLIFQLMTPTILKSAGGEAAGRFGMGLQITNGMLSLSDAIPNVRFPAWGRFAAQRAWNDLDGDFSKIAQRTMLFIVVLSAIFLSGIAIMPYLLPTLSARMPDWNTALCFTVAAIANQWAFTIARYLRAHRHDPFMGISLLFAGAVAVACWIPATRNALVLPWMFMASSVIILAGMGSIVFLRCKKAWHT